MGIELAKVTWRLQKTGRTETKGPRDANLGATKVGERGGGRGEAVCRSLA